MQQTKSTIQTVSGLDIAAGVWLILAPFILSYSDISAALWNSIIVGLAVIVLSSMRTSNEGYRMSWPSWLSVVLGVWLILSPFVLGYDYVNQARWNDIILGVIIGGLALWGAVSTPSDDSRMARERMSGGSGGNSFENEGMNNRSRTTRTTTTKTTDGSGDNM